MLKKIILFFYLMVLICMGVATVIEKYHGTDYVSQHVYGARWFSALWAILTAVAVIYFVRRKVKKAYIVLMHLSFVIILAGALLTHITAQRGVVHLRMGETSNVYIDKGVLAKSNGELVERVVRLAKELGREIATPDEARQILSLKK